MFSVLVVDDDELMRDSLSRLLSREGFKVAAAASGPEAIELAAERYYELVVCDVRMPKMDGLETVRRLRQGLPDATLIMITGYASEDAPVEALRLGVHDYLRKPFALPEFLSKVRGVCRQRRWSRRSQAPVGLWQFLESWKRHYPGGAGQTLELEALCTRAAERLELPPGELEALTLAAWLHPLATQSEGREESAPPPPEDKDTDDEVHQTTERLSSLLAAYARREPDRSAQLLRGLLALRAGESPAEEIDKDLSEVLDELAQQRALTGAASGDAGAELSIKTLGKVEITFRGRSLAAKEWESSKARWLFVYLVSRGGQMVPQERLAQLFWPGGSSKKSHRALVSAVHRARKALGEAEVIARSDGSYGLNPEISYRLDVEELFRQRKEFLRHLHAGHQPQALECAHRMEELFAGEFMPRCYEDWALDTRYEVNRRMVEARERVAQLLLPDDPPAAERWARKALELEDTSEVALAVLIRSLAAQKRRRDALEAYQAACEHLLEELGLKPGDEIEEAYQAVASEP